MTHGMAGQLDAMKADRRWGQRRTLSMEDRNEVIQLAIGLPCQAIADAGISRTLIRRQPRPRA